MIDDQVLLERVKKKIITRLIHNLRLDGIIETEVSQEGCETVQRCSFDNTSDRCKLV